MVLPDWTFEDGGYGTLDSGVKLAGTSSYIAGYNGYTGRVEPYITIKNCLYRTNFSEKEVILIFWLRAQARAGYAGFVHLTGGIEHRGYGRFTLVDLSGGGWDGSGTWTQEWTKYRVTFWYDPTSNIRWGRVEHWDDSLNDWVQDGGDVNFGSGEPISDSIRLVTTYSADHGTGQYPTVWGNCWWDEMACYRRIPL